MRKAREEHKRIGVIDRRGYAPATAAIILVGVVVAVGVGGFFALGASGVAHTSSSSVHSCEPSGTPQCKGTGNSTGTTAAVEAAEIAVAG